MTANIKTVLNPNSGFIVIPRAFAESFVNNIKIENTTTLYFYLLLAANYKTKQSDTEVVKRGELLTTIRETAFETRSSYDHIQRLLKQLEVWGLVAFEYHNYHRHIILPYYEEHCGRRVRTVEQVGEDSPTGNQTDIDFDFFWGFYHHIIPDVPETDYEEARKAFARLSLKDRRTAAENIPAYFDRLNNTKHAKWAAHYLKERCFILPKEKN